MPHAPQRRVYTSLRILGNRRAVERSSGIDTIRRTRRSAIRSHRLIRENRADFAGQVRADGGWSDIIQYAKVPGNRPCREAIASLPRIRTVQDDGDLRSGDGSLRRARRLCRSGFKSSSGVGRCIQASGRINS